MARNIGEPIIINSNSKKVVNNNTEKKVRNIGEPVIIRNETPISGSPVVSKDIIKEFSPITSGALTPSNMQKHINQTWEQNKAVLNAKRENQQEVQPYIESYNKYISDQKTAQSNKGKYGFAEALNQGFSTPDSFVGASVKNYFDSRKIADEDLTKYEITDKWTNEEKINLANQFKTSPDSAMNYAEQVNKKIANDELKDLSGENVLTGILSSVASVPLKAASSIEQGINMLEYATAKIVGRDDYELRTNYASDFANSLRTGITDAVDLEIGNWDAFDFVYNTIMSGVDSLAMATSGGAGTVLLGLSAAADTTNDIISRGGTSNQAFWGGLAAGTFETIFEKISLGNLKAFKEQLATTGKKAIKNLAKSMLVNASEEGATEIANIMYDIIANGDISNWNNLIKDYENQGLSTKEARKKAAITLGLQVLESMASGALMGFGFGGIGTTITKANSTSAGKIIAANESEGAVINQALSMDKNSESYKMASEINNSGKMTPGKIGGLAAQILEDINNKKSNVIKGAIQTRANELNVSSKDANSVANYFAKFNSGEKISKNEIYKLSKNSFAKQIIKELQSGEGWVNDMNSLLSPLEQKENIVSESASFKRQGNSILQSQVTTQNATPTETEQQSVAGSETETQPVMPNQPITEQAQIENDGAVGSSEIGGYGLTNPTDQEIYREPTTEEYNEAMFGEMKNAKQRHILDVAKKLDSGMKVVFVDKNSKVLNGKNGKYNRNTNILYIAKDLKTVEMYSEVFKHEFIHRLELRKAYDSFKNYLFKKSKAFESYANARLYYIDKVDIERTRDEAINGIIDMYVENTKGDLNLTREQAEREAVADFVARTLFKDKNKNFIQAINDKNIKKDDGGIGFAQMETDLDFFSEMATKDRNLLQKFIDAIKDLIASIKGMPNLEKDLQYLEERLTRVYNSADMKKTATESGEAYYYSGSKSSEQLYNTPDYLKPDSEEEWSDFNRQFSNKTNDLKNGEKSNIIIYTADYVYLVAADGYMSGKIVNKFLIDGNEEFINDTIKEFKNGTFKPTARTNSVIQSIRNERGRSRLGNALSSGNITTEVDGFLDREEYSSDIGRSASKSNVDKIKSKESYSSDNLDTDYLKAVENNDIETAQRLVDEAARKAGYIENLYHQTENDFFKFDTRHKGAGTRDNETPFGIFMKKTDADIGIKGKKQMRLFAKITNPLKVNNRESLVYELKKMSPKYQMIKEKLNNLDKEYQKKFDDAKNSWRKWLEEWRQKHPTAERREAYNDPEFEEVFSQEEKIVDEWSLKATELDKRAKEIITNALKENGYDGIILLEDKGSFGRSTEAYIALEPTQVKSADPVTYDDNGNVIPLSERFNENEADIRYSSDDLSAMQRDLYKRHKNGEITNEEYLEETDKLWGEALSTYGAIPEGENAKAPIPTPKAVAKDKPTELFTRSLIETGKLTDEMLQGVEEKVLLGGFSHEIISDEKALQKADSAVKNGTAEDIWKSTVDDGKRITKNQIAIGERLLKDAIESENTKRVLELGAELADIFTRAGQVVQSASLLKKMTGAGRLVSLQRTVKTINKDLRTKYGVDYPPIKISEESAKRLAEAKTAGGIEHAYQEIMQEIADQVPVTFLDKWNAWRHFAMLSNPKTHIRNIVGNGIFVPAVRIKNALATVMEKAVSEENRTKSLIIKKEFRDFAKNDVKRESVKNLLKGNKYNDKSTIREKQKVFKSKALNFLTDFNSNALEAEDMLFKNIHYINALAGFLQARKVDLKNVSQDTLYEARIYAVEEAKKATFNDESALANAIQRFGNKNLFTNILVEGVLPFKRTPINIIKRGIEYSPLGLIKTATKGLYDVKKGKISLSECIDGFASGLTGTGLLALGMVLASIGAISGGEDDDEKSRFEKLLGKQEYAVQIGNKSYTVDWAAPANIPFFIGVEIANISKNQEEFTFANVFNTMWNALEPITNLSMLSGIQSVIESARYAEPSQVISSIAIDALTSYGMQVVPSLSGAVSRTIDPTQRSWYTDKNDKWLDSTTQTIKNNIQSKVPGLSFTQIPKIDMWGREVSRGGTAERVLENFVSPGYYSEIEVNETSEELKRIFEKTDIDVFPNVASKSFELEGKTKHLTAQEYVTYAKAKGEYSYDYIKEFMEVSSYKKLTDEEKAEVIESLYRYANAKAKTTVSNYDLSKQFKTVSQWERNGKSAVDYYIYKAISK